MKNPDKRKTVAAPDLERDHIPSLDIDVTPPQLQDPSGTFLGELYAEMDHQWPQGRDEGGGRGSRIGTVYAYFDTDAVLHLHFAARGAYLERMGELKHVPVGNLPGHFVHPAANVADSPAAAVAELLVTLPKGVDPDDPRWDMLSTVLKQMRNDVQCAEDESRDPQ